jgi:hypothetical protein
MCILVRSYSKKSVQESKKAEESVAKKLELALFEDARLRREERAEDAKAAQLREDKAAQVRREERAEDARSRRMEAIGTALLLGAVVVGTSFYTSRWR